MGVRTYCDECGTAHFDGASTPVPGLGLEQGAPPGWAWVTRLLAAPDVQPVFPPPVEMASVMDDGAGGRRLVKSVMQIGQTAPPRPEKRAVPCGPVVLCPQCAEPRLAGIAFCLPTWADPS